jgi:hypothetical protein
LHQIANLTEVSGEVGQVILRRPDMIRWLLSQSDHILMPGVHINFRKIIHKKTEKLFVIKCYVNIG